MNFRKRLRGLWPELQRGQAEAVHEARKLTRRAQAALRVDGGHGRARRAWRDLRRMLAPVRDWDAVGVHLRASLVELGASPRSLQRFDAAWARERAARWAEVQLPDKRPPYPTPGDHPKRLRRRLESDWAQLLERAPQQLAASDETEWHTLRKALKALRYTWELSAEPPEALLKLLEALGRVQDAHVALAALDHPALPARHRPALEARERADQAAALAEARQLWPAVAALQLPD